MLEVSRGRLGSMSNRYSREGERVLQCHLRAQVLRWIALRAGHDLHAPLEAFVATQSEFDAATASSLEAVRPSASAVLQLTQSTTGISSDSRHAWCVSVCALCGVLPWDAAGAGVPPGCVLGVALGAQPAPLQSLPHTCGCASAFW